MSGWTRWAERLEAFRRASRKEQARQLLALGLCAAAVLAMAYRFANLDLAAFIMDEPHFLKAARAQLVTGVWARAMPISGSQGFYYGPSITWFYGVAQLLLGPSPRACIVAIGFVVTASQLWLAAALARSLKGGLLMFSTLTVFMASSPYLFFFSRIAWDPLVVACTAGTVALLLSPRPYPWWRSALVGAFLGVAVSSHLNVLPFVAVLGVVLLAQRLFAWKELLLTAGPMAAAMVLVNVPYLTYVLARPVPPLRPDHYAIPWLERAVQLPRISTVWGVEQVFGGELPTFLEWWGFPGGFAWLERGALGLALLACALGAFALWRARELRWLSALGLCTWGAFVAFHQWKQVPAIPHYQFPTWWFTVVALGAALAFLAKARPAWGVGLGVAVWLVAAGQLAFVRGWMGYVRERGGMRTPLYSTPVAQQEALVKTACSSAPGDVYLVNQTVMFPISLEYLADIEPSCAHKRVTICSPYCPPQAPGARGFAVRYAMPHGAAVSLVPL